MTALYELALILAMTTGYALYTKARKKRALLPAQGNQTSEMLAVFMFLGILALGGIIGISAMLSGSAVKVCLDNEKTIETAFHSYMTVVGTPAAGWATASDVTVHNGTTPGTFSNPVSPTTDYLQQLPKDPVNPNGFYTFQYTSTSSTQGDFTIICPGPHSAADLAGLPGTTTQGKIEDYDGAESAT
jgi:type II secretory pathway pseudopilin PulG